MTSAKSSVLVESEAAWARLTVGGSVDGLLSGSGGVNGGHESLND